MKNADVELIQRVLDGDDTAFSTLVNKYRKSVHALAWRKVQDFHIAEDITQETFLKAYQNLTKLKSSQSFSGWLYVIATNHCKTWLSKKRLSTQSLENTDNTELEKATYSSYVSAENERASVEVRREVVRKLLAKLQESDRTVITLYYLGGMTYEEISKFLGVSVSSIKNRLYRARQFLKKEETMIKEALENYQITPHLTYNIMDEIARLKPTPSPSKPLVPWAIAATSAILIVLLLGIGSQQLVRFQNPYSLDAQAELTVELLDAPIVLKMDTEPDVRNRLGNSNVFGTDENEGQKPDKVILAAAQVEGEDKVSTPKQKWIESAPTEGTLVEGLLATSEGVLYTLADDGHIYKLQDDGTGWQHVSDARSITDVSLMVEIPIAKWGNTLYILLSNKFYAATDDGKMWNLVYQFHEKYNSPTQLLLTEQTYYIVFEHPDGAFRSEDKGKTWKDMSNEFPNTPRSIIVVQDKVFAWDGTRTLWLG